jgi:oxalate---CoA ligase
VKELQPRPPCSPVPHTYREAPRLKGRGQGTVGRGSGGLVDDERMRTPTEEIVARIWTAELRLPSIGLDEDFIDLGSHSLQGVAVVARLEEHFGLSIPIRVLFEEPTVADLAAWIDRQRGESYGAEVEIIRLQKGSGLRPIFAVPSRRGGSRPVFALAKLARETDPRRPVFAFYGDPPVPANTPKNSWVQAVAGSLTAVVRTRQHHGPYLLLGSCVGGIIAWEMARQLEARGEIVHLFLVDTKHPRLRNETEPRSDSENQMRRPARKGMNRRLLRRLLRESQAYGDDFETVDEILVYTKHPLPRASVEIPSRTKKRTRPPADEGVDRRMLKEISTAGSATETAPELPEDGKPRLEMTRLYRPEPLQGRVRLITNANWRQSHPTLGWDSLLGDHRNVAVMGKEHGLLRNVHETAAWLRAGLDEVDPGSDALTLADRALMAATVAEMRRPSATHTSATIAEALASWAERTPDAPALVGPDCDEFDYGRFAAEVERLSATLRQLGIHRDDPIVIVLPDGPELTTMILAGMTAGIAAPLSWGMTRHEYMEAMSNDAGRVVVVPAGHESPAREAATDMGLPLIEVALAPPGGAETFQLLGDPIGPPTSEVRPQADDIALIISSSGTTGRPRRIPRTHRNITTTSADVCRAMEASPSDRCLNLAPMAFSQGLNALFTTVWAGGSLAAMSGIDLARLPDQILTHRPTWFSATPSVLRTIAMDEVARSAVRAFPPRFIRASAGAISATEIVSLEERLATPVLHSYGMSEASFIAGEHFAAPLRKPGSAGMPNHEVAIVQADGAPVASGDTGEITVRGPHVFPGYLGEQDANGAVFLPHGWLRTGDVGMIDEDGFLFVTGRLKEMIKCAGLSISPREIEDALLTDPAVAEACAFGIPHPDLGEEVAAAVVVCAGAEVTERRLRNRVASRLSLQKVPRSIMFVTEIPKTPTGKPLRSELATAVEALLTRPATSGFSSLA